MSEWELSGLLVRLGDIAAKHAKQYNASTELYGYGSMESVCEWWMFHAVLDCIRCFKGFDVEWDVCKDEARKIKEFVITYDGEEIGIPWKVVR